MRSACELSTPIGVVRIEVEDGAVVAVRLPGEDSPHPPAARPDRSGTGATAGTTGGAAHPPAARPERHGTGATAGTTGGAAHPPPARPERSEAEGRAKSRDARIGTGRSPVAESTAADVLAEAADPVLAEARRQLAEYFEGRRTDFDLPLRGGGTPFQEAVWAALRAIPAGETRSYADIARAVGKPAAVRAVGAANGRNPIAIVVPCHRVIGSDGTLTGYAGGVETKRWLLAHERGAGPLFSAGRAAPPRGQSPRGPTPARRGP